MQLNGWSHPTYRFLAAGNFYPNTPNDKGPTFSIYPGCYISIGDLDQAQKLLDKIPSALNKKIGGKDLPTEVLIRKKCKFAYRVIHASR